MQAISRAHRMGQDKKVFVYRFITLGTIEEKIRNLQETKNKIVDTFIEDESIVFDQEMVELILE